MLNDLHNSPQVTILAKISTSHRILTIGPSDPVGHALAGDLRRRADLLRDDHGVVAAVHRLAAGGPPAGQSARSDGFKTILVF